MFTTRFNDNLKYMQIIIIKKQICKKTIKFYCKMVNVFGKKIVQNFDKEEGKI